MQENLSASHKDPGKNLDRLPAAILTGMSGIYLNVYKRLVSWLPKKISQLRPDRDTSLAAGTAQASNPTKTSFKLSTTAPPFFYFLSPFPPALITAPSPSLPAFLCLPHSSTQSFTPPSVASFYPQKLQNRTSSPLI